MIAWLVTTSVQRVSLFVELLATHHSNIIALVVSCNQDQHHKPLKPLLPEEVQLHHQQLLVEPVKHSVELNATLLPRTSVLPETICAHVPPDVSVQVMVVVSTQQPIVAVLLLLSLLVTWFREQTNVLSLPTEPFALELDVHK